MKHNILGLILLVLLVLTACDKNNLSHVFETPFPFAEIDAYADFPYDNVVFVSNNDDSLFCTIEREPSVYFPYEPHDTSYGNPGEGNEEEEDEPESGDYPNESHGIEVYQRNVNYNTATKRVLQMSIYVTDRAELTVSCMSASPTGVKDYVGYSNGIFLTKPSNEIFDFLTDTVTLFNNNDKQDYLYLVKGKGVVEFARNSGSETWHLVE